VAALIAKVRSLPALIVYTYNTDRRTNMARKTTGDQRRQERLRHYRSEYVRLQARLREIGFICAGTLVERWMQCGKPNCACASDRASQHGPYFQLSWKEKGKTVSRRLPAEHARSTGNGSPTVSASSRSFSRCTEFHKRPAAICCRLKKPKKHHLNQGIFLPLLDNPGVYGHLCSGNAQNHLIFLGFSRCQKVATPIKF
jgi:hypothetical protein